jgi:hypothetical protein
VVGVGEIHAAGGDVEELLAVPGDRVAQVDDVHDLGAAVAGDLHSTHDRQPGDSGLQGVIR